MREIELDFLLERRAPIVMTSPKESKKFGLGEVALADPYPDLATDVTALFARLD